MDATSLPSVLFAGSGGQHAEVKVHQWDHEDPSDAPAVVSRFPKGYSVYALAVSPAARYLVIGTRAGLVRVYPLSGGLVPEGAASCYEFFHHDTTPVLGVDFCTDDLLVTGGKSGTLRIWSTPKRQRMAEIQAHPEGLVALQAMRSIFLATIGREGTLKLWDLDTLSCRFQSLPFQLPKMYALTALAFSVSSRKLYHPTGTGDLVLYDVLDKLKSKRVKAHEGDFCAVAVNSRYLATAGMEDRRIRIWDLNPESPLLEATAEGPVISLAWISEKELATVYANGNARLWRIGQALSQGPAIEGLDLRTCAGLSERCMTSHSLRERWNWRQEQVRRGQEITAHFSLAAESELLEIIADLEARGFPSEAMTFRAYLARETKSKAQYLQMIERLLATLQRDQLPQSQLPALSAAFDLLRSMNEPASALEYGERLLRIDPTHSDCSERCEQCRRHPLLGRAPETIVRLDLGGVEAIQEQVELSRVLGKRFLWNIVLHRYHPLSVTSEVQVEELKTEGWVQSALQEWDGRSLQTGHWFIRPLNKQPGLSLGVQISLQDQETQLAPCLIFQPAALAVEPETVGFNRAVADAIRTVQPPEESFVHRWMEPLLDSVRATHDDHRF